MDIHVFIAALRARFHVFAIALVSTVAAATVATLGRPDTYRATVDLLVGGEHEQSLSESLSDRLDAISVAVNRPMYLQTQVDIITSPRVAREVMDDLDLANHEGLRGAYERSGAVGTIDEWLIENHLLPGLDVGTSVGSVIHLSFAAEDAAYAAVLANAFAKAYADTVLELRVEPARRAAQWFAEQHTSLQAGLVAAQRALTGYQKEQRILAVPADGSADVESAALATLSSQMLDAEAQASQSASRERQVREAVAQDGNLEGLPDLDSNERIRRLRARLLEGEVELRAMATRFGPSHPTYRRRVENNARLRETLDSEAGNAVAIAENSREVGERREAELSAAHAALRAEALERRKRQDQAAVLAREVESTQSAYDSAAYGYLTSRIESRAEQADVAVLNPAAVPLEPYLPSLPLNIVMALIVGTSLGIGLVILAELSDRRVRSVFDLVDPDAVESSRSDIGVLATWRPLGPSRA